jgi:hypothetical protein
MLAYVSIGNSDDKLPQWEWAAFVEDVAHLLIDSTDVVVHGAWFSVPHSAFQNGCWCVETEGPEFLKAGLRVIAHRYRQDSIAWARVPETEFLR